MSQASNGSSGYARTMSMLQRLHDKSKMQRSELSDMEQLALPEKPVVESDLPDFSTAELDDGRIVPTPSLSISMPAGSRGWSGFKSKQYKNAYEDAQKAAPGAFDKIRQMVKSISNLRPWDEERAVIDSGRQNWKAGLPSKYDAAELMSKQRASSDVRKALEQRAGRTDIPEGGFYLGIEPLDETVVKSPVLHKEYSPWSEDPTLIDNLNLKQQKTGVKFGQHGGAQSDLMEAMQLDARKRVAMDDLLSKRKLAPESMYVETSAGKPYIVQDKAEGTVTDVNKKRFDDLMREKKDIENKFRGGEISDEEYRKLDNEVRQKSYQDRLTSENRTRQFRENLTNEGFLPADWHDGNIGIYNGDPVVIDSQGYEVRKNGQWESTLPIERDSRRAVTFRRK